MIPRCFMLKNGSTAVLRTAVPEDAAQMIAYLRACAEETDFLLRLPEEWGHFRGNRGSPAAGHGAPRRKTGCWCAR